MPSEERVVTGERALTGERTATEERVRRARETLAPAARAFASAVAVTADQVRALVGARAAPAGSAAGRVAAELGPFASGRIDPDRLASIFADGAAADPDGTAALERALAVLMAVEEEAAAGPIRLDVVPGGSLAGAVGEALARAGRAFGAARSVERVRAGDSGRAEDAGIPDRFPFERWSRAERRVAPPLVVEVDGGDLVPGALAGFLDGSLLIVLVVRGGCPPAPLARLVSPGVLVMQTGDPGELGRLESCEGPAVAALVPEGAARFVHVPAAAGEGTTLEVSFLPEEAPRARLGALSAFQQAEELALLRWLAAVVAPGPRAAPATGAGAGTAGAAAGGGNGTAATAAQGGPPPPPVTDADRLAAWLLRQAALPDPETGA